jgi:hypothetical protein
VISNSSPEVCPERVVEALEVVEVDEDHRDAPLRALRLRNCDSEPITEQLPVRQQCEHVVIRMKPDLFLGALQVVDVDDGSLQHDLVIELDPADAFEYLHGAAIGPAQGDVDAGDRLDLLQDVAHLPMLCG